MELGEESGGRRFVFAVSLFRKEERGRGRESKKRIAHFLSSILSKLSQSKHDSLRPSPQPNRDPFHSSFRLLSTPSASLTSHSLRTTSNRAKAKPLPERENDFKRSGNLNRGKRKEKTSACPLPTPTRSTRRLPLAAAPTRPRSP
jgi:hypothetical protein